MINSISLWLINCQSIIVIYLQLLTFIVFIEAVEQTKKQQTKSTYNTETYKPNNLLSKESTWISQTATKCDSSDNCTILTTNSICINGTCKCDDSFIANIVNKTCVHQTNVGTETILPLMIVMGVMFVGICIAMNLFSRSLAKKHPSPLVLSGRIPTPNQTSANRPYHRRSSGSATPASAAKSTNLYQARGSSAGSRSTPIPASLQGTKDFLSTARCTTDELHSSRSQSQSSNCA